MADFKVGDVVRFKTDEPGRLPLIVRDSEGEFLHCSSECKRRRATSHFSDLELVNRPDPQADLKQAIRDVLLSDEFMAAFAAAWRKTPIPMAIYFDDKGQQRIQSLAGYPFGEPSEGLAIAPITGSESEAYYLDKLKKGEAK